MVSSGNGGDPNTPVEIAAIVEASSVKKVRQSTLNLVVLGMLAGVYIGFGALFAALVLTDSALGFGITRLVAGLAFSIGLVLVVVGGAELFTGNNLIVIAWVDHQISLLQLLRNWVLVYAANFAGALALVMAVTTTGILELGGGGLGETIAASAVGKVELSIGAAFGRGVLANVLVCLAVWLATAAHTVTGKVVAIVMPVSAFVALGFEHSVANMFILPMGILAGADGLGVAAVAGNLVPVTLGNIVGGSGLVAMAYWTVTLRQGGTK